MSRSKASLLEEMEAFGTEMMAILLEEDAVIKPRHLELPTNGEYYKMSFIKEGAVWLLQIYDTEYAEVQRIKKMQPEEMWARYKSWGGFEDCREVLLLKGAITELRAVLVSRSRPDLYKKSKRNAKKNKTKAGIEASRARKPSQRLKSQNDGTHSH